MSVALSQLLVFFRFAASYVHGSASSVTWSAIASTSDRRTETTRFLSVVMGTVPFATFTFIFQFPPLLFHSSVFVFCLSLTFLLSCIASQNQSSSYKVLDQLDAPSDTRFGLLTALDEPSTVFSLSYINQTCRLSYCSLCWRTAFWDTQRSRNCL